MKIFFTLISLCSVINLVLSQYNFEVYEFNYNRNPIVYNRNNGYNINLYNQNPFLSSTSNYVPQQSNINYQSGTVSVTSSGSCANYFSYVSENNQIIGHISMTSSDVNRNVINITLSVAAHLPSKYAGDLSLVKDRSSVYNDIQNGLPVLYRVRFPIQNPVPKLTAIYYNDQLICTGPKDQGQYVTTITLDHTLYTGLALSNQPQSNQFLNQHNQPQTQNQLVQPQIQRPAQQQSQRPAQQQSQRPFQQQSQKPVQPQQTGDRFNAVQNVDFDCGVPEYSAPVATGLVVGGQDAARGQFPWLTAYYHNGVGYTGFICGGSLVSTKIVVTAAHCMQNKGESTMRKSEEATFYIGKHNLQSLDGSERGWLQSGASQFNIHPDWNIESDRYDADIAIVVLIRVIQFNRFIKPICMPPASSSYNDVVNKNGIVAGWGKTEFNAVSTDRPQWVKVPIVDEGTCLRSNTAFSAITSERTFCAGDRNSNTGPCNGDSGGGLVIQNGNRWYLRGIVSSSLIDKDTSSCDTHSYAVFTAVSSFSGWIQGFVQQNG